MSAARPFLPLARPLRPSMLIHVLINRAELTAHHATASVETDSSRSY